MKDPGIHMRAVLGFAKTVREPLVGAKVDASGFAELAA